MYFEIIGAIAGIQRIAVGRSIRDLARLREQYGAGHWRKLKGVATVRLTSGRIRRVELHWYEAHGVEKKEDEDQTLFGLKSYEPSKNRNAICPLYPE